MKYFHSITERTQPRLGMHHLMMISVIAREKNLTKAANEMGVTPSALSHRLAEAERRLGTRLFDRSGRNIEMTPAGETLCRASAKALAMVTRAESDVAWLSADYEKTVRICMGYYSNYHWFPDFLREWSKSNPSAHACIVSDAKQHSLDSLRNGLIDVCILPFKPDQQDVASFKLFADELLLISHPAASIAKGGFIEGDSLAQEQFLTYTRLAVPDQEYERFLRPQNAHPARFIDMEPPEVIADLVAAGHGVSILSQWAMQKWIDLGLVKAMKITQHGLPISWYAVTRVRGTDDETPHELAQALARFFAA